MITYIEIKTKETRVGINWSSFYIAYGVSFLSDNKDKNFGFGQSSGEYIGQHKGMGFRNKEEILW